VDHDPVASIGRGIQHLSLEALELSPGEGTTFMVDADKPFPKNNGSTMCDPASGLTNCSFSGSGQGNSPTSVTASAEWCVGSAGAEYLLKLCATAHNGNNAVNNCDGDTSVYTVVATEYPAPPAIANWYLNDEGYDVTEGMRGEIIQQIAHNHADEKYGPHGGDSAIDDYGYDKECIENDVDSVYFGWLADTDCEWDR